MLDLVSAGRSGPQLGSSEVPFLRKRGGKPDGDFVEGLDEESSLQTRGFYVPHKRGGFRAAPGVWASLRSVGKAHLGS